VQCTFEMFGSLKCDELDAFIMAHQDCEKPEFTQNSQETFSE
jgi:hypothetical protein